MIKRTTILVLAFLVAAGSFGCKSKTKMKGVELEVSFGESQLSDNLITDVQMHWTTTAEFEPMDQDMNVFVHFWHKNNLILQDDHAPTVPTSQWEAGKDYVYTRRIYIPPFIDEFDPAFKGEETLRMSVGFYSPFDRSGESKQEVLDRKLKVLPPPLDTPEVIYEDGWYDLEMDSNAFLKQWRWTGAEARCVIDNPGRDALLVIKGGVNLTAVQEQKIIFKINDLILDDFIAEESHFEKSYNIKKEMLGDRDEFYLSLSTDKTFVPANVFPDSSDDRELGIQISFIYFR